MIIGRGRKKEGEGGEDEEDEEDEEALRKSEK